MTRALTGRGVVAHRAPQRGTLRASTLPIECSRIKDRLRGVDDGRRPEGTTAHGPRPPREHGDAPCNDAIRNDESRRWRPRRWSLTMVPGMDTIHPSPHGGAVER